MQIISIWRKIFQLFCRIIRRFFIICLICCFCSFFVQIITLASSSSITASWSSPSFNHYHHYYNNHHHRNFNNNLQHNFHFKNHNNRNRKQNSRSKYPRSLKIAGERLETIYESSENDNLSDNSTNKPFQQFDTFVHLDEQYETNSSYSDVIDAPNEDDTLITYDDRTCPRDREEAKARGQSCLRKCNSHKDCISSKRRCLCDGLCGWSCIRPDLNCEELPNIVNSRYVLTNKNFFHSRLIYECDPGYIMSGSRERVCQGDGSWSGWPPQCKTRPVCGSPPFIPHSKHSDLIGTEFELNKTVLYECFNGYQPHGTTEAVCVYQNGTVFWSIDLICVRKNCGDPGHIENGYRKISGYVFTSSVNYFCNDGYILSGRALRYCQSDGHWSSELPICKPVKCSQPEDPPNGRAFYDNYTFGSLVKYQCKTNFKLHGPNNRTCQSNREWSGDEPTCKLIDCGQPEPFSNGYIEVQSTTIGSIIYFYCFDGMVFDGLYTNSTCGPNSTWIPEPFPKCLAPCIIPIIENGYVDGHLPRTMIQHGQSINVTCIDNYDLLSFQSNSIVCQNGTWSQFPVCVPARCKRLPPRPTNGFVVAPKTDHGQRALFICHDGYEIQGPNITFCHFGIWNISSPICHPIYCPFPGYLENGKIMLVGHMGTYDYRPYIKHVTNNRQILFECDRGYSLVDGPPGATCIDGQWSPRQLPRCELYSHPKLLRWNRSINTLMRFKEETNKTKTTIKEPWSSQSQNIPFSSKRFRKLTNSNGKRKKRHHSKPSCLRLPEKKSMKISIVRLGNGNDTYPHGTRIRLVCNDGYVLTNPNRTLIKCAKGRWKPELPECVPAPCITPTVPNARFHFHRRLLSPGELIKHENRIEFLCNDGYFQPSTINDTLRCSYGSWDSFSSLDQICQPKPCSINTRWLSNGKYIDIQPYVEIFEVEHSSLVQFDCVDGYKPKLPNAEYRCLFGRIEPEQPHCIYVETAKQKNEKQSSSLPKCRSPEKIENALLYFNKLLSQRLTLISFAQVEPTTDRTINNKLDYNYVQHSSLPFEYEHGTEIVFRCITYAQSQFQSQMNQTMNSIRSTWIIKCENGNWIGRSFECDADIEANIDKHWLDKRTREEDPLLELSLFESSLNSINVVEKNLSCLTYVNDSNVLMYQDNELIANGTLILHGTAINISCSDIGRFQLIGPKQRNCHNGILSGSIPYCAGLSQEFNYSLEKPPTILFRNQLGPIIQYQGQLIVYPGVILHLDCLWKRKYGTPQWSWKFASRQYLQYWTTDSSLEYRLTIFHAHESDSGIFTCQTPNLHIHTVEILVKAVHCPNLNLTKFVTANNTASNNMTTATTASSIAMNDSHIMNNGQVSTLKEENNKMDTIVHFQCNQQGTILIGANSTKCLASGHWSKPVPTCKVIECYDLTINLTKIVEQMMINQNNNESGTNSLHRIEPAQIVEMKSRSVGSKVTFTCPRGYGLQGSNYELECLITGSWSGSIPYCQEVQCGEPLVPKNGYIEAVSKLNIYYAGDIVQYACNNGYMIDGNPISICQENGRWSGPITKCKPSCNYPGLMHGLKLKSEVKFFYEINETITFECYDGSQLKGNKMIKCISSSRWSGSIPECIPIGP